MNTFAKSIAVFVALVLPGSSLAQSVNPWNNSQVLARPNTPPMYLEPSNSLQIWANGNNGQSVYAAPDLFTQLGTGQVFVQAPSNLQPIPNAAIRQGQAPYAITAYPLLGGGGGSPGALPTYGYAGQNQYAPNGYGQPYGYGGPNQYAPTGYAQPYGYPNQYPPNGYAQPYGYPNQYPPTGYAQPYGYGAQYAPYLNGQPYGYGSAQPYGYGGAQTYGYGAPFVGGNYAPNAYPGGTSYFSNSIPSGSSPFFGNNLFGFR